MNCGASDTRISLTWWINTYQFRFLEVRGRCPKERLIEKIWHFIFELELFYKAILHCTFAQQISLILEQIICTVGKPENFMIMFQNQ